MFNNFRIRCILSTFSITCAATLGLVPVHAEEMIHDPSSEKLPTPQQLYKLVDANPLPPSTDDNRQYLLKSNQAENYENFPLLPPRALPLTYSSNFRDRSAFATLKEGMHLANSLASDQLDFSYHDHAKMTKFLKAITFKYSNLTLLYSIGNSVHGRDLWVVAISSTPKVHIPGKPEVKYVANIHGNEAVGREMMLHLIRHLVINYDSDPYVKWLLDNTRIHIMPSMNPDGFEASTPNQCDGSQGRTNDNGADLNRNFPDFFRENRNERQPEADAVRLWSENIPFILSGGLHGGALVASYPFDNTYNVKKFSTEANSPPSIAPDDDVFQHLSMTYSSNHPEMKKGLPCKPGNPGFRNGITNGAAWYPLTGGMQDYNYIWHGCMEVTLEISCCKYPPAYELPRFWEDNKKSLLNYLGEVHRGVKGFVSDILGNPVRRAALRIKGRDVGFQTTDLGEYWRILLPGHYKLEVFADGYEPLESEFRVNDFIPTFLNITLFPSEKLLRNIPRLNELPEPLAVDREYDYNTM